MSADTLASLIAKAGSYPLHFNKREARLAKIIQAGINPDGTITTQGDLIVGDLSGAPARLAKGSSGLPLVAGASTVSYAALAAAGLASGSVTLAKLASGVTPSHVVKFAGKYTTSGGAASEDASIPGVVTGDIALVSLQTKGAVARTIVTALPATDKITLTFSGDPSTDHVVSYMVLRAAA